LTQIGRTGTWSVPPFPSPVYVYILPPPFLQGDCVTFPSFRGCVFLTRFSRSPVNYPSFHRISQDRVIFQHPFFSDFFERRARGFFFFFAALDNADFRSREMKVPPSDLIPLRRHPPAVCFLFSQLPPPGTVDLSGIPLTHPPLKTTSHRNYPPGTPFHQNPTPPFF